MELRTVEPAVRHPSTFRDRYGPWALVTGASSGIGRAMAAVIASAGVHVLAVGRRDEELAAVTADLRQRYVVQTRTVAADLATPEGVHAVEQAGAEVDLGLLVAAAGFGTSGRFVDADLAGEQSMLDVNCRAVLALTHAAAVRMTRRGSGGIVLLASVVGRQGTPQAAHYAATKAYVQAFGEALHVELRDSGVDVVTSTPGPVSSGFGDRAGMRFTTAAEPIEVARATLNALGRRMTVSPGALSKTLNWSLAPLPRQLRTRIMGRVMGGFLVPR
ncbi:SDR family NAD(P)-dependent oxidoreductase [Micromonospora sp. R77]|uniref:SDR family NAD(P)-dependent oxidoreductase n=1 Tax=Micromonospora sp. R77 TaxID=2925836 RepID=UPI001F607EC2|nr:SDR family NAD(P)-dependent oxidoreductase [Micromonospora sp. R77]MCI4066774.1 SDR family NAD(P)-dependent oxidoreductase [Micromonospora sp. R77]